MKTIHKLKQSTSNFKNHFVRDSKVIVAGTLFMFMVFGVVNVSAVPYKIVYDDNVTSNMPEDIKDTTMNNNVNISSNTPTRDGYSFLKWCTQVPASDGTCPGTEYSPGAALAISGTSQNNYKLYAMWKETPKIYIQDLTLSQCQVNVGAGDNPANVGDVLTVYDKRDENDYTVRYINGECWMTQNLRITGAISAEYSNFSGSDFNVSAYDLKTNGGFGGNCYDANSYNYACSRTPDNTDLSTIGGTATAESVGAWYNYYAATAGTISTNSNTTAATSDICPSGWHLPTGPNTTSGTDYNKLVGNTTSGWQNPTTGLTAFGAVLGGNYTYGSLNDAGYGYWWSSTASRAATRYSLLYNSSNGQFYGNSGSYRDSGYSVRCVRSS